MFVKTRASDDFKLIYKIIYIMVPQFNSSLEFPLLHNCMMQLCQSNKCYFLIEGNKVGLLYIKKLCAYLPENHAFLCFFVKA